MRGGLSLLDAQLKRVSRKRKTSIATRKVAAAAATAIKAKAQANSSNRITCSYYHVNSVLTSGSPDTGCRFNQ